MTDLDVAIRAKLAGFTDDACTCYGWLSTGYSEMREALLALVDEHEQVHRRLGEPHEDHSGEGLPLCEGWPYRPHADRLCRHVRTVAEKLGIGA